jgi:SAM-dependent methyltransferase
MFFGVLLLLALSAYYSSVSSKGEMATTTSATRMGHVVPGSSAFPDTDDESATEAIMKDEEVEKEEKQKKEEEEGKASEEEEETQAEEEDQEDGMKSLPEDVFPACDSEFTEIIPCHDRSLQHKMSMKINHEMMEHYERHCPPDEYRLRCLIPAPTGYKTTKKWPESRDSVWTANIPHTFLAQEKANQNWMEVDGDTIHFPGGGTHFPHGADAYIRQLAKMLGFENQDISGGGRIRTVFDVGCGVASFGAYLLPYDVVAMSLAPNDVHANQIQFALERGIPAALGVLGTMRLPFPSKSFDLAHCSRCRIDWWQRDGVLLLEIDRMLRPGGFYAWSSPPVYRDNEEETRNWATMTSLVGRMCWRMIAKEGQTVIWQKPMNNECYMERKKRVKPPMCDSSSSPDSVWGVKMTPCINPAPEGVAEGSPSKMVPWPKRLVTPPARLSEVGVTEEAFKQDTEAWNKRVGLYLKHLQMDPTSPGVRNVMDMNANLGGFAAALTAKELPVWVMNVVPSHVEPSTLRVIYDRGLLGTTTDWCESFSTYPRTYDLVHGAGIISDVMKHNCNVEDLLFEVDRILRPEGYVILRDSAEVIDNVVKLIPRYRWTMLSDPIDAPEDSISTESSEKIVFVKKYLWEAGSAGSSENK